MRKLLLAAVALLIPLRTFAAAPDPSESYFVTIERVDLKKVTGEWVKVIEPDRRVDLGREDPVVQFFNNTGRVPSGRYCNVRVTVRTESDPDPIVIRRKADYERPLAVSKGSFIRVDFAFERTGGIRTLDARTVREVVLVVDEDERPDPGDDFEFKS